MPGFEVLDKSELKEIQDIFENGSILFRHGFDEKRNNCFKVKEFENNFAKRMKTDYALAVSSGTAALRVALAALNIGPGDEVITQSFTFVATVEAIIESGATPICADIDNTLNMCWQSLISKITPKTKAIIVVHMLGMPANLEKISKICSDNNIFLIEDTAWGCGGYLKEKPLGTWGDIGTFSFDFAKTITTGEGGMLVCKSKDIYSKASAWHDHGHENNPKYPRWEDSRSSSGFNFRMSELQGAVGIAQLKKLDEIVSKQRKNKSILWNKIKGINGIEARETPFGAYETSDALVFLVQSNYLARKCRKELISKGLNTKILPEAYSWHFAGEWNHMKELVGSNEKNLKLTYQKSHEILSRAVAIPIYLKMDSEYPTQLFKAISIALEEDK